MMNVNQFSPEELARISDRYDALCHELGDRYVDAPVMEGRDLCHDVMADALAQAKPDLDRATCERYADTYLSYGTIFSEAAASEQNVEAHLKDAINRQLEEMDDAQQWQYLSALRVVLDVVSGAAISSLAEELDGPDVELILPQLEEDVPLSFQIEDLHGAIDDLCDAGNMEAVAWSWVPTAELLADAVHATGPDAPKTLARFALSLGDDHQKAALLSCAVHIEAMTNGIDGVAPDIDPALVTCAVNAGIEEERMYSDLAQGKIDELEASARIERVARGVQACISMLVRTLVDVSAFVVGAAIGSAVVSVVGAVASAVAAAIGGLVIIVGGVAGVLWLHEDAVVTGKWTADLLTSVAARAKRAVEGLAERFHARHAWFELPGANAAAGDAAHEEERDEVEQEEAEPTSVAVGPAFA